MHDAPSPETPASPSATPFASFWYDGIHPKAQSVQLWLEGYELKMQLASGEIKTYPTHLVRWPERQRHGQRQAELPDGSSLIHRSVIPTQTCSFLNKSAVDFLLHRGWFRRRLATKTRAFLSTG